MKIKCYKVKLQLKIKYFNKMVLLSILLWNSIKILDQTIIIIKENFIQNQLITINQVMKNMLMINLNSKLQIMELISIFKMKI